MCILYAIKDRNTGLFFARQGAGYGGHFYMKLNHARLYQTQKMAEATLAGSKYVRNRGQDPVVVPIVLAEKT